MKIFVLSIFCALTGYALGGSIAWPGAVPLSAPVVKSIIPGETKINAYSTSQYINAVPAAYQFGGHPHFAYQVPQVQAFPQYPSGYYSIGQPSYIPGANIFYPNQPAFIHGIGAGSIQGAAINPAFPGAPSSPNFPTPTNPAFPTESGSGQSDQSAGDADSAVIESADLTRTQQKPKGSEPIPASPQPEAPLPSQEPLKPISKYANFQAIPQIPQGSGHPYLYSQFSHNSQESGHFPSAPQFLQTSGYVSFPLTQQISQGSEQPMIQKPQESGPQSQQPQGPSYGTLPQFGQFLQISQKPNQELPSFTTFPQFPQEISQLPSFPQIPQNPQESLPQLPQLPGYPQNPQIPSQSPPSSFPGAPMNTEKGLNDEDTISVESA